MKRKKILKFLTWLILLAGIAACSSNDENDIIATGITLNKDELSLIKGTSEKLIASISPENTTNKTIVWVSSNPSVASVDNEGTIRALQPGCTVITASTANGKFSASCSVTVNVNASKIILSGDEITLEKGDNLQLTTNIKPDNTTDEAVTWTSSNPEIVNVDNNGFLRAKEAGQATITARTGSVSVTCVVIVKVSVKSVSLDKTSVTLIKGQNTTLAFHIQPEDATNRKITWASSDSSMVSIDNGTITALKPGRAFVTVRTADGYKTATCMVIVKSSENIDYSSYEEEQIW